MIKRIFAFLLRFLTLCVASSMTFIMPLVVSYEQTNPNNSIPYSFICATGFTVIIAVLTGITLIKFKWTTTIDRALFGFILFVYAAFLTLIALPIGQSLQCAIDSVPILVGAIYLLDVFTNKTAPPKRKYSNYKPTIKHI